MKAFGLGLLSVFLVSCAHKGSDQKIVSLPYAEDLVVEAQQSRGRFPASVPTLGTSEVSTRRVYFSTLYEQYLVLSAYTGKEDKLNSCPQFHGEKQELDRTNISKAQHVATSTPSEQDSKFFPELAFDKNYSMEDYQKSVRAELVTLCEYGVSDNYYKYENLVTHFASNGTFHKTPHSMRSVLKIPIFANHYLVEMISGEGKHEAKKFIELSRTEWFGKYVSQASHKRRALLESQMAKR